MFKPWIWLTLGVVLICLDAIVGSNFFLLCLGLGFSFTGLVSLVINISWQAQVVVFCLSTTIGLVIWRRSFVGGEAQDQGSLNNKTKALLNRTITLKEPIIDGHGKVLIDGIIWKIMGPEAVAGSKVVIKDVNGTILIVDKVKDHFHGAS